MSKTLYRHSVDPVVTDGRDIDLTLAELTGEGAQQQVKGPTEKHLASTAEPWNRLPEPQAGDPTYYDRPLLKESVWTWDIPAYYFIGGAAGASLALGAAAQFDKSGELSALVRRCHLAGVAGSSIGGVLLIHDLGRPSRFLNMLRVFRPTSPMNMGAWILSGAAPTAIMAALLVRRPGISGRIGEGFGLASGLFGLGLATYTGVLVANSAVPVWHQSRRILPILFGASGMASAGSIFDLLNQSRTERRITHTFGTIGRVAELAAGVAMERAVSQVPAVAKPLHSGFSGFLWRTATVLTAASLVVSLMPRQSKPLRTAAGVLGVAGSLALRFAVDRAGVASARDPRSSFHGQRAGSR